MQKFGLAGIRTRLSLLVLAAALPALIFIAFAINRYRKFEERYAKEHVAAIGERVAHRFEAELRSVEIELKLLARLESLRSPRAARCAVELSDAMGAIPGLHNLAFADKAGRVLCSAVDIGAGANVNVSDRDYFKQALLGDRFAVGSYQVGRITKKAAINAAIPVKADRQTIGILYTALDLDWIEKTLLESARFDGTTMTLIDSSGIILSRLPSESIWIGRDARDLPVFNEALVKRAGFVEGEGIDGIQRLYSYRTLTLGETSYSLMVGVPVDAVFIESTGMRRLVLALFGAVLLLGAAVTWVGVDFLFLRRVRRITAAMNILASGELSHRLPLRGIARSELDHLERSINKLAETLENNAKRRDQDELALTQRAELLEKSRAELTQISYLASFHLQKPLVMISSYLHMLANRYRGKLHSSADRYIATILEGLTKMETIINDLLVYTESENEDLPLVETDMNLLVDEVVAMLATPIKESAAFVTHGELPTISANPHLLKRLLHNLIENSLKFRGRSPPRIHVYVAKESREWVFAISDNGVGIDPRYFQSIFLIFNRLHTEFSYVGNGIGLAICKKIVERHGGRIWVESELQRGSVFRFTLPMRPSDILREPTEPPAASRPEDPNHRIFAA